MELGNRGAYAVLGIRPHYQCPSTVIIVSDLLGIRGGASMHHVQVVTGLSHGRHVR